MRENTQITDEMVEVATQSLWDSAGIICASSHVRKALEAAFQISPSDTPPPQTHVAPEEVAEHYRQAMLEVERRISIQPVKELLPGQTANETARFLSDLADLLREARHKVVFNEINGPSPEKHVDRDRLIGNLLDRWEMTPNDLKEKMREHGCGKQLDALMQDPSPQPNVAVLEKALAKINDIRNSIIGCQKMNWSEHIYPLVAALNEAGIEGQRYPEAREYVGTMLERTLAAESDADRLRAALKLAIDHIEHMAAHFSNLGTGYSFESLGEDMPGIKAALATTEGRP